MTDKELLNQALEYLEDNQHWVADGERHAYVMEYNAFIDKLKQALAQPEQPAQQESYFKFRECEDSQPEQPQQEPMAVYGYCPQCGAKGAMRERRPNGNDKCANGHTYPSSTSTPPQRTWVGLESEEIRKAKHHIVDGAYHYSFKQGAEWAETHLKEKNNGN